jgi:monoamine oxidase
VDYWAGLRAPGGGVAPHMYPRNMPAPPTSTDPFENQLRRNWMDHPAPHEMVAEMHRQLMAMHGVAFAPEPVDAAFMDWSEDPYGAGVHLWRRGYKSWEMLQAMTQPVSDFPCYICGEAYSTVQTWAEGALQTAEIVLQKHLGLPAPGWITGSNS